MSDIFGRKPFIGRSPKERSYSDMSKDEYVKLKVVVRADAAMKALSKQGEEEKFRPFPRADIDLITADGKKIWGIQNLKITFDPRGLPTINVDIIDTELDIHIDPDFFAEPDDITDKDMPVMASRPPLPNMKSCIKGQRLPMGQQLQEIIEFQKAIKAEQDKDLESQNKPTA